MRTASFRPSRPLDLAATLAPLRRGRGDPSARIDDTGVWRATRTPDGPVTVHLATDGDRVRVSAWGPGAAWAVDSAPALVGEGDDGDAAFRPAHPLLADLRQRHAGVRVPRSNAVVECLVPTVLEQKVTGSEARRSYARIVRAWGEPAPGPAALLLPPSPERLADMPSWAFHAFDVERRRAETIRRAARVARRLEEAAAMAPADATRRLQAVPGVGAWSAAEVGRIALGDADAVPVGDYHLPHLVSWCLAGEPRGTDERMLELLEPYRGHRARVLRLLEIAGPRPARRGPRMPHRRIARH